MNKLFTFFKLQKIFIQNRAIHFSLLFFICSLVFRFSKNLYEKLLEKYSNKVALLCYKEIKILLTFDSVIGFTRIFLSNDYRDHIDFRPRNNWTVIDVGAHYGMYSIYVSKENKEGKIIAIEPEPNNFKFLKFNIKLNDIKNIIPLNFAIFSKENEMVLHISKHSWMHSLLSKNKNIGKIKVKTITLDNIIKTLKLNNIDLLKIDAEGVAHKILEGAINSLNEKIIKRIVIAITKLEEINSINILKKYNYKIYLYKNPYLRLYAILNK